MPALAPTITPVITVACVAGTKVADLAPGAGETDPGPFVYVLSGNPDGGYALGADGVSLDAAIDLEGTYTVGVTVSGLDEIPSLETTATLGFSAVQGESPYIDAGQGYAPNPQFPPAVDPEAVELPWQQFLTMATTMVVPGARDGVDFVVARPSKLEPDENVYWNEAVLGPRPDAEIEAQARFLASSATPSGL